MGLWGRLRGSKMIHLSPFMGYNMCVITPANTRCVWIWCVCITCMSFNTFTLSFASIYYAFFFCSPFSLEHIYTFSFSQMSSFLSFYVLLSFLNTHPYRQTGPLWYRNTTRTFWNGQLVWTRPVWSFVTSETSRSGPHTQNVYCKSSVSSFFWKLVHMECIAIVLLLEGLYTKCSHILCGIIANLSHSILVI